MDFAKIDKSEKNIQITKICKSKPKENRRGSMFELDTASQPQLVEDFIHILLKSSNILLNDLKFEIEYHYFKNCNNKTFNILDLIWSINNFSH